MPEPSPQFSSILSTAPNPDDALVELIAKGKERLPENSVDMIHLFCTEEYNSHLETIADQLNTIFEPRVFIGHSVRGVFGESMESETGPAISLMMASLPGVNIQPFHIDSLDFNKVSDDTRLFKGLVLGEEFTDRPSAILIYVEPFTCPILHLMPMFNKYFADIPMIGGVSSSSTEAGDNRLIYQGQVVTEGAVGVVIGPQLQVRTMVAHSCRPIGQPWVVTKAEKNILHELGGHPVMDIVKETAVECDDRTRELINDGLFVGRVVNEYQPVFQTGDFLIRNVIGFDAEKHKLAVSDYIRAGQTIQFHVKDPETADMDLREQLQAYCIQSGTDPLGILINSSHHRGYNLFRKQNHETELIYQTLGSIPTAGYFASGEIGPVKARNLLNAQTTSIAIFEQSQR